MNIKSLISKHHIALTALVDQAIHSGTTFLTGILVGRLLSVGDFGEFSLGLTLMVFSMIIQDNCLATPYTYKLHNSDSRNLSALRAGALIQSLFLSLLCSALLFIAYIFLPKAEGLSFDSIIFTLAFAMPFLFIRETSRRIYFTEFKLLEVLKMDAIVSLLQISLIISLWYFEYIGTATVFAVIALASLIGSFWAYIRHRADFNFSAAIGKVKADTIYNIIYGRWLLIGSLCHLGSIFAFPWLLYLLVGKESAGVFAACYTLVNLINPFVLSFNNFFRPKIMKIHAQDGFEEMHTTIIKLIRVFLPIAIFIALFIAITGEYLVYYTYGSKFSGLGLVMGIVGLSSIFIILNAPLQLGVLALNKPQTNPKFHSISLASTLIFGIPLVSYYGITGAAIGYTLSIAIGFFALVYFYIKEINIARRSAKY